MADLALHWNAAVGAADLILNGADLALSAGLYEAVIISLFTDRRASADDELPDPLNADRRGWWGDYLADQAGDEIGSKLWLLKRAKMTRENVLKAKDYAEEALKWLVSDGVAKAVIVTTEALKPHTLAIGVQIQKPDGSNTKYDFIWSAL